MSPDLTPKQIKNAQLGDLIVKSLGSPESNVVIHPDVDKIEQHLRERCSKCGAKIPPGKAGRMCKPCRENKDDGCLPLPRQSYG